MTEEHKKKLKEARELAKLKKEGNLPPEEVEKKLPKEKKEKSTSDEKLDAVLAGINTLAGAVGKLVELQTIKKEISSEEKKPEKFNPKLDDETYPQMYVPPKYRKIVDEFLSPEFGLRVVDFEDRTDFMVEIIVPPKYSSLTKEEKEGGMEDVRSRMVTRALGENGVREWTKLVRKNLSRYYQQEGVASPFINQE